MSGFCANRAAEDPCRQIIRLLGGTRLAYGSGMAKTTSKRLVLNKAAIKRLVPGQLELIGGGAYTVSGCPVSIIMTCTSHG
jgi:hypothetical protein